MRGSTNHACDMNTRLYHNFGTIHNYKEFTTTTTTIDECECVNNGDHKAFAATTAMISGGVCVDSGCTSHVCGDLGIMFNYKEETSGAHVTLAKNKAQIQGRGAVSLLVETTIGKKLRLILNDVLYVPGATMFLLSVSKIVDGGATVTFNRKGVRLRYKKHTFRTMRLGGLYILRGSLEPVVEQAHLGAVMDLHRRYNHIHLDRLKRMARTGGLTGVSREVLSALGATRKLHCVECAHGKSVVQPLPRTTNTQYDVLEKVHSDYCGPFEATRFGNRYVISFIDDPSASGFVWLRHLPNRTSALTVRAFQDYVTMAELHTGQRLKILQCDNALEYKCNALDQECAKRGCRRQYCTPHAHGQNGVAERLWRTLQEGTTTLLKQAGLSNAYREEAMDCLIYTHNRVAGSEGVSKYEQFYGRTPTVPPLHPFGCSALATRPPILRRKGGSRVQQCIMLGYSEESKGAYILLNLDTRRVIVRKSVTFFDNVFPLLEPTAQGQNGVDHGSDQKYPVDDDDDEDFEPAAGVDHAGEEAPQGQAEPLRRSARARQQRQMFDLHGFEAARVYDQALLTTGEALPASADSSDEPDTYNQAMAGADHKEWLAAVKEEIESHRDNNTFTEAALPTSVQTIGSRWVFKIKRDREGKPVRFKARLVAKGFSQIEGVHYTETFAPTLRMTSLRFILALTTQRDWDLNQLDVKTAFLIPELPPSETVYMKAPPGLPIAPGHALRLNKCIYGLKQASRYWNCNFHQTMMDLGFRQSDHDQCVYTLQEESTLACVLALYVDDVVLAGPTLVITSIKSQLMSKYNMTDGGYPSWLLGVGIDHDERRGTMRLSQKAYVQRLLVRFGMSDCKSLPTPAALDRLVPVTEEVSEDERVLMEKIPYRSLVGGLLYLMVTTRPDIAFAVTQLAKFVNNPRQEHWRAAKRTLRYLRGTMDLGITYKKGLRLEIRCYSDADWATDPTTRRSVTGYVVMVNGGPVSWRSQQQRTVAQSSCEAELMALAAVTKEALWMRKAMAAFYLDISKPLTLFEDNQGCIAIANNQRGMSSRTKHIETRYFAVREQIQRGHIVVVFCRGIDMVADILTKPLGKILFARFTKLLGMVPTLPEQQPTTTHTEQQAHPGEEEC